MNKQSSGKTKEYYLSVIFLILTVIFWGISFISTKILLTEVPPASIAFFRQIIALVPLAAFSLFTHAFSKISFRDLLLISASGLFGIVLYFIFENTGLKYTTASNASMIVASVPIFTLFSEAIFFKLKIKPKMILCLLLSILGVYLVISINGKLELSSSTFMGNMLIIGAMVCWVIYTIQSRSLSSLYSGITITTYQTLVSVFLFIPFIAPEIKHWKALSLVPLLNLIYLGFFCSAVAYFFYIYATKRLGATVSAAFLNLIPVVSVITSFFVLGEKITLLQTAGMLLIISSLYILTLKSSKGSNTAPENEMNSGV
ncbi:MAG: DMT family transporter [Clostridia bacterium]|nr:DMT family transporter [Clostridia bacterium]